MEDARPFDTLGSLWAFLDGRVFSAVRARADELPEKRHGVRRTLGSNGAATIPPASLSAALKLAPVDNAKESASHRR